MPLDLLEGRHFPILGGSSGIGYATATYLLRAKGVVGKFVDLVMPLT